MLSSVMNLWRGEPLMKKAIASFGDMLTCDEFLFNRAWDVMNGRIDVPEIRPDFYAQDKVVNQNEHEIRRLLVEHLSVNKSADIPGCLILMSLVKDAERIGDYTKNIFEVGVMLGEKSKNLTFLPRLSAAEERIARNIPLLKQAFLDSDETLARRILRDYTPIKNECSAMLDDLLKTELPTREAVATALLSRYLKRVNSHISNIGSGIILPLDQIDFVQGDILE